MIEEEENEKGDRELLTARKRKHIHTHTRSLCVGTDAVRFARQKSFTSVASVAPATVAAVAARSPQSSSPELTHDDAKLVHWTAMAMSELTGGELSSRSLTAAGGR